MSVAEFITSQITMFGIPHAIACQALEVSQPWFYKWINRAPTAREQRRERLQFVEGLTDRQAAEAVRAPIDFKYALVPRGCQLTCMDS
nr:hypothetical protein OG999_00780 [Streptomyces sp. NBC_00886]